MNKALKIKIPDFLSRTKAIKLHDWYVNKMPDWWWYKAIRSGEEGEDVEYIELNFGNISEIENKKLVARKNLSKDKFTYSFNRTKDDHIDGCGCTECELKTYFKSKEFMKIVKESTGIEVSEITIISVFNFSLLFKTKFSRLSEPHSSSPSIRNLILKSIPTVSFKDSYAFKCIYICPLSSEEPLA